MFTDFDADSLERALELLGLRLRYDIRASKAQVSEEGGPWVQFTDPMEGRIRNDIAVRFEIERQRGNQPYRFSDATWRIAFNAILYHRTVDPFRQWLESLPEWDGTERISGMLATLFDADASPLTGWASSFIFKGAVQRCFQPGAKLDEMPVLFGPQDIGKSTLLACLLPEEHRDIWFSDSLDLKADPKNRAEALQGRVIVEAAELTGLYKAEIESLKAFISRQDDGGVRLAWRRNPEPMPRRCVIVGTTNDEHCLPNDPTGLRRFVPIRLREELHTVREWLDENRGQLWAEALAWWHRGGERTARLPRNLKRDAAQVGRTPPEPRRTLRGRDRSLHLRTDFNRHRVHHHARRAGRHRRARHGTGQNGQGHEEPRLRKRGKTPDRRQVQQGLDSSLKNLHRVPLCPPVSPLTRRTPKSDIIRRGTTRMGGTRVTGGHTTERTGP